MPSLFDPIRFGAIEAANRVVMAPLTRDRAGPDQVPTPLMATYYGQRASAGLIVTEATQISPSAQGYLDTPGIHSAAQIAGWRRVCDTVHAKGGKIVLQLWHVGRISHLSLQPGGAQPVSSTSRQARTKTYTAKGFEEVSAPRALERIEIAGVVENYARAARNASTAGFDGVEVHSANGYLLEQFLRDSINDRHDEYGGPQEHRVRFPVEVMAAVAAEVGADRTGLRISPVTPANDAGQDSDAQGLFQLYLDRLAPLRLAFVHVIEGATGGARDVAPFDYEALRRRFKSANPGGAWIVNNGYTRAMAIDAVASGHADLVAFGKPFIANPDLVRRLRLDAPLNAPVTSTFYGGGAQGYTDYPTLAETAPA
ncbi:MAG TPA: alkene reductase [Steroidobacteraceae bacterium]|nr:alkene reductase [Steroidobacteraceae bacterium]